MPHMEIQIEGTGGKYAHVLRRYRRVLEVPESVPLRLETLDHGMQSGAFYRADHRGARHP